jgi:hypothetical protein
VATTTDTPAALAESGTVNTAVVGGNSTTRRAGGGIVVGVVCRTLVVVDVGTAHAVSANPTATRTVTANATGRDRTDLDSMARLFRRGEVASCLVDRSPTPGQAACCSNQASPLGG